MTIVPPCEEGWPGKHREGYLTGIPCSLQSVAGQGRTDPNALTKQAAESALVRAKRARQMNNRTLKSGFATATEEKNEMKIRISLANPFRGGRLRLQRPRQRREPTYQASGERVRPYVRCRAYG